MQWVICIRRALSPSCSVDMTLIFLLTSTLLWLITKSKEIETTLDLSTIKLAELFEDTTFWQSNHTLFVLSKPVKIILQIQNNPFTQSALWIAVFPISTPQLYK